MGSDLGPEEIIIGIKKALSEDKSDFGIIVVGGEETITPMLLRHNLIREPRVRVYNASEVIGMDEKPIQAIKTKKDSSMMRAIEIVKLGTAGADFAPLRRDFHAVSLRVGNGALVISVAGRARFAQYAVSVPPEPFCESVHVFLPACGYCEVREPRRAFASGGFCGAAGHKFNARAVSEREKIGGKILLWIFVFAPACESEIFFVKFAQEFQIIRPNRYVVYFHVVFRRAAYFVLQNAAARAPASGGGRVPPSARVFKTLFQIEPVFYLGLIFKRPPLGDEILFV